MKFALMGDILHRSGSHEMGMKSCLGKNMKKKNKGKKKRDEDVLHIYAAKSEAYFSTFTSCCNTSVNGKISIFSGRSRGFCD